MKELTEKDFKETGVCCTEEEAEALMQLESDFANAPVVVSGVAPYRGWRELKKAVWEKVLKRIGYKNDEKYLYAVRRTDNMVMYCIPEIED